MEAGSSYSRVVQRKEKVGVADEDEDGRQQNIIFDQNLALSDADEPCCIRTIVSVSSLDSDRQYLDTVNNVSEVTDVHEIDDDLTYEVSSTDTDSSLTDNIDVTNYPAWKNVRRHVVDNK